MKKEGPPATASAGGPSHSEECVPESEAPLDERAWLARMGLEVLAEQERSVLCGRLCGNASARARLSCAREKPHRNVGEKNQDARLERIPRAFPIHVAHMGGVKRG